MPTLNEVKDQITVVRSVGEFTNALQQIATIRMIRLRDKVMASRPFVEEAQTMLTELSAIKNTMHDQDLLLLENRRKKQVLENKAAHTAVIVITSNQGLTGRYNIEIFQKMDQVMKEQPDADYFIIGKKGQEYFRGRRIKVRSYPYALPEDFSIDDLKRLIELFDYYPQITLVYSRYLNSAKRDIVAISIVKPVLDETETADQKIHGRYTFEPDIFSLIEGISAKLRAALFQQQIFDARLAQNSSQMIGMKTASDNANELLADLRMEYNKQRRKMIDKKIGEVFAGSALW